MTIVTRKKDENQKFAPDDWETPTWLAQRMAKLATADDKVILEPAAGTGQIAQWLPAHTICFESNDNRRQIGERTKQAWYLADFLTEGKHWNGFDLIITNPPFSTASGFIAQGLECLNQANPNARLLYLLPSDFFQSVGRYKAFASLGAHIHHEYKIVNRVAYLRYGEEVRGRQIYDSVFDIRRGKDQGTGITFWRQ